MAPSTDKKPSRVKAAIAKKTEALNNPVKMADMPLLVRLLWKNQNVFSKSWLRDWFVVFKNRHAFFSVFLCHPQHPFSWKERFVLILCVLMFGYALATAAEVALTRAEEIALENVKATRKRPRKPTKSTGTSRIKMARPSRSSGRLLCKHSVRRPPPLQTSCHRTLLHDHTRNLPLLRR